jgi:N-acetylglucosaminyldiphosphoundecaprenol N-acetyl-beta-D-mannosaminyltransferase
MQRTGVEWLFRLITEPRRLAPRYFLIISMFMVRGFQQLSGWKSYAQDW